MSALDRLAKSGTFPALAEYGDPGHIYAMDDERIYIDKAAADAALEELAERLSYAEGAACDYWRDRCWRAEDKLAARIAEFTTGTCPVCEGSGYEPNRLTTAAVMTCHNCGGLGWVTVGPAAADLAAVED